MNKCTYILAGHSKLAMNLVVTAEQELLGVIEDDAPLNINVEDCEYLLGTDPRLNEMLPLMDSGRMSPRQTIVLATWRAVGFPIVRISREMAEGFANTEPPTEFPFIGDDETNIFDDAMAIEVDDYTFLSIWSSKAGKVEGFESSITGAEDFFQTPKELENLVRNVRYVLAEYRAKSSFDGFEISKRERSAKGATKRGRRFYPGVDFLIGSTKTIHLNDQPEKAHQEGEGREGWTFSVRSKSKGHWRHQAHGPRHSLRKVIWIKPFWRGPVDGPTLITPTEIRP